MIEICLGRFGGGFVPDKLPKPIDTFYRHYEIIKNSRKLLTPAYSLDQRYCWANNVVRHHCLFPIWGQTWFYLSVLRLNQLNSFYCTINNTHFVALDRSKSEYRMRRIFFLHSSLNGRSKVCSRFGSVFSAHQHNSKSN